MSITYITNWPSACLDYTPNWPSGRTPLFSRKLCDGYSFTKNEFYRFAENQLYTGSNCCMQVFHDLAMEREVLSLPVRCSNCSIGCQWRGELRRFEVSPATLLCHESPLNYHGSGIAQWSSEKQLFRESACVITFDIMQTSKRMFSSSLKEVKVYMWPWKPGQSDYNNFIWTPAKTLIFLLFGLVSRSTISVYSIIGNWQDG